MILPVCIRYSSVCTTQTKWSTVVGDIVSNLDCLDPRCGRESGGLLDPANLPW